MRIKSKSNDGLSPPFGLQDGAGNRFLTAYAYEPPNLSAILAITPPRAEMPFLNVLNKLLESVEPHSNLLLDLFITVEPLWTMYGNMYVLPYYLCLRQK